jgi:diketogulonate reductase-like aldo/keto reductase
MTKSQSQQVARKQLGITGIQISAIGFGTWRYKGGVLPLQTAIEQGAPFIDTAETYGSEEVVGDAVKHCRKDVFIATKVRPANFKRTDLIKAAESSLRRLKTDYIDLYQLHWPNYTVPIAETMSAMEELVNAGKVRFIGVSNFSKKELKAAQSSLCKYRIVSNQVQYSLVERTIERELLQYCQKERITIIAYSPLGMNFQALGEHDRKGLLKSFAARYAKTEAQLALNWLLEKDSVIVIPKASTPRHVVDDCGASGSHLDHSDYNALTVGIRFRRRGLVEASARRFIKAGLQRFGKLL